MVTASRGNPFVHPEVLKIVELHDSMTHATETFPIHSSGLSN